MIPPHQWALAQAINDAESGIKDAESTKGGIKHLEGSPAVPTVQASHQGPIDLDGASSPEIGSDDGAGGLRESTDPPAAREARIKDAESGVKGVESGIDEHVEGSAKYTEAPMCCWVCEGTCELVQMEEDGLIWCTGCWTSLRMSCEEDHDPEACNPQDGYEDGPVVDEGMEVQGEEAGDEGQEAMDECQAADLIAEGQVAVDEMQEVKDEGTAGEAVDAVQEDGYEDLAEELHQEAMEAVDTVKCEGLEAIDETRGGGGGPELRRSLVRLGPPGWAAGRPGNRWCISEEDCRGTPSSQVVRHFVQNEESGFLDPADLYCIECWKYAVDYLPFGHHMVCLRVATSN